MKADVGARLGPYELVSRIGTGGMGRVYRARDTELDRFVAIKVIDEAAAARPLGLSRFEREARLASSLNHPNIITVYSVGNADGTPYIAMELVEGRTLRELLANGPLPLKDALNIAGQIATAIAKAHDAGIVHRDLKPQNVMVTHDGLVKVLDFGLSTLRSDAAGALDSSESTVDAPSTMTAPGALIGTVQYMSPEQASGRRVDFRSDQFCFGSLLYEMLTNRRPFQRPTEVQTLAAIIEDDPQPIGADGPGIPDLLATVIERCLAKNPEERYASTHDLARDVRMVREQLPGQSNLRTRGAFLPAARRRPGPFAIAAAVAALALLAWLTMPTVARWIRRAPPTVTERQQLAVLPFSNVGNEPASQAFGDGLVETLTTQLTQLSASEGAIEVVPASDVRHETVTSARDARRLFGVSRVITGSVQRTATHVRVTVNLVDAISLRQLSARAIDLELQEVAAMQDRIVREVAELLGAQLRPGVDRALAVGSTKAPAAYDLYLQARGDLQRYEKLENVDRALGLFQRAAEQDPSYALAHAGLGEAFWRKYQLTKDPRWVSSARESCATALRLADGLAPVHMTLGLIDAGTGRYDAAVSELKQAIALDPASGDAYRELANAYQALGKTVDAEATYKKAIAVRPGYWASYNDLGRFYFRLSRYREAEAQFRRVIDLTPDNARAYNGLGAIYYSTKRYDDAAAMFEKSVAISPSDTAYSNLGTLYFSLGRYTDAARMLEQAVKSNDHDSQLWNNLGAGYYWAPGERGKATAAYQRALALTEDDLRVDPRNPALLIRLADCYAMLGDAAHARPLADRALSTAPQDTGIMYKAGMVYEQLGDRDRALQWITKALALGYSRDVVERSPSLAALRADSRFKMR